LCDCGHDKRAHRSTALSHGWCTSAGGRSAYVSHAGSATEISNETQSCCFGCRRLAGWNGWNRRSGRWTRRIHRQPRGWSIWRAIDWQRADDIADLQSVYAVHGDSVARGAGVAGKPWFSVSLTAENCWCCGLEAVPAPIRRAVTPLLAWCSAIYPSYKTHAFDQYEPFQFKSVSAQAWTVGETAK
jgi:hypothetical protein